MRSNRKFNELRKNRYSSFDKGMGKDFENGLLSLADLYKFSKDNDNLKSISGKQELYESIINQYL